MRRFLRGLKAIFTVLVCILLAIALVFLIHSPVFQEGKAYELYLAPSSSSLTVETKSPVLDKLFLPVKGESVRYDGDKKEELLTRFHAEILFTEEAAGVTNYYCFSPFLGGGVLLFGEKVNLHIALSNSQTAVGTPLIFGGF